MRSKRAILDLPEPPSTPKTRGATKSALRTNENSSSNVLMELRKAANHPMLFRRLYTDRQLVNISKDCLREMQFTESDPKLIVEDLEVMTDFEIHRFMQNESYKVSLTMPKQAA